MKRPERENETSDRKSKLTLFCFFVFLANQSIMLRAV